MVVHGRELRGADHLSGHRKALILGVPDRAPRGTGRDADHAGGRDRRRRARSRCSFWCCPRWARISRSPGAAHVPESVLAVTSDPSQYYVNGGGVTGWPCMPPTSIADRDRLGRIGDAHRALVWRMVSGTPPRRRALAIGTPVALLFLVSQLAYQGRKLLLPGGTEPRLFRWLIAGARCSSGTGSFALIAAQLFARRVLREGHRRVGAAPLRRRARAAAAHPASATPGCGSSSGARASVTSPVLRAMRSSPRQVKR